MGITEKEIKYIANLARLNIAKDEAEGLTRDIDGIVCYFTEKLNELNTENVKPMEHILSVKNVFRDDICVDSYDREELLKNAPVKDEGCFMVPKVVE